jgi:hypothetical protein
MLNRQKRRRRSKDLSKAIIKKTKDKNCQRMIMKKMTERRRTMIVRIKRNKIKTKTRKKRSMAMRKRKMTKNKSQTRSK